MSRHDFRNAFQIFDLSKNATATATLQVILARYAMNHHGSERKGPDPYAMRHDLARAHL